MVKQIAELIRQVYQDVDQARLKKHLSELVEIELGQTFQNYSRSAEYVYQLLQKEGFQAEKIRFPAGV